MTEHHNAIVFGNKGQNREGDGHDVWVGIPYERLNKIRLTNVKLDARSVTIEADLTQAYEPELGVKKYTRNFAFSAPDSFVVTDSIETANAQTVTAFFHSDKAITKSSDKSFIFEPGGTSLIVDVLAPADIETKIEKNTVTAPGPPGAVDKGTREERGVRLAVSTPNRVSRLELKTKLTIDRK
jgi:hypothetical protein